MEIKYLIEVSGDTPAWFLKFDSNDNEPIFTIDAHEALSFKTNKSAKIWLNQNIADFVYIGDIISVTEHGFN